MLLLLLVFSCFRKSCHLLVLSFLDLQKQFAELEAEERVIGIPEVLRGSMQEYYNEGGEPFMREQQEAVRS